MISNCGTIENKVLIYVAFWSMFLFSIVDINTLLVKIKKASKNIMVNYDVFLFVILFIYYHDNLLAEFGHSPEHACVHYRPNLLHFVNLKSN